MNGLARQGGAGLGGASRGGARARFLLIRADGHSGKIQNERNWTMSMTNAARIFLGGKPTGPAVALLEAATVSRQLGDLVTYAEISAAIHEPVRTNRFRAVLDAWRKKLYREKNIKTEAVSGQGIRLCLEHERAGHVFGQLRRAGRSIVRGAHEAERILVEKLETEQDRRRAEHARRVAEVAAKAVTMQVNELALTFRAPRQLPHAPVEPQDKP